MQEIKRQVFDAINRDFYTGKLACMEDSLEDHLPAIAELLEQTSFDRDEVHDLQTENRRLHKLLDSIVKICRAHNLSEDLGDMIMGEIEG